MVHRRKRRRKARRSGSIIGFNRKRHGRRRKARNRGRFALLGAKVKGRSMQMLTAGYSPSTWADLAPVGLGAFSNFMVRNKLSDMIGLTSPFWKDGIGSFGIGILTAGAHYVAPAMVMRGRSSKLPSQLFAGAMLEELMRAGKMALAKAGITGFSGMANQGEYFNTDSRMNGLGRQGEYFTQGEAAGLEGLDGQGEFLTTEEDQDAMVE